VPYDERDTETQRFTPTYSDEEFLEAVRKLEVAGSSEVADQVDCTTENARVRLNKLTDRGELRKREVGGRNVYLVSE